MKSYRSIIMIVIIVAAAIYLILPNPVVPGIGHAIKTYLGLDLVGGIQVLLEANLPEGTEVTSEQMQTARQIVENRVNGLGVSEAVVQLAGDRRIVVELPGIDDPEQAVNTIKGTALLEFVDLGSTPLPAGTVIQTDYNNPNPTTPADSTDPTAQVYHTIMTGANLANAGVITDQLGRPAIGFELDSDGAQIFAD